MLFWLKMLSLHDLIRWNLSQIVAFCERLGPSRATIHRCAQIAFHDVLSRRAFANPTHAYKKQKERSGSLLFLLPAELVNMETFLGFMALPSLTIKRVRHLCCLEGPLLSRKMDALPKCIFIVQMSQVEIRWKMTRWGSEELRKLWLDQSKWQAMWECSG